MDMKEIVEELQDIVFEDNKELDQFVFMTNGYVDLICWNELQVYDSENSDRGWDDDKDDHERTIKQQILYELKLIRDELDTVIEKISKNDEYV